MRRWLRRLDTLFVRLFLLMWVALVGSHMLAFMAATGRVDIADRSFLLTPALPPLAPPRFAGPPRPEHLWRAGAAAGNAAGGPTDGDGLHPEARGGWFGHPPRFGPGAPMLWLDYLVRVLVIGLFAAAGAYWLAAPIRRLSTASQALGDALTSGRPAEPLDEHRGTTEVRQASRVFNEMGRRLREQLEGRSLLMAAISHDLRTPLTRLRIRLETMSPAPAAAASVSDVREMDALIASVLDLVRGQHGATEQRRVDVSSLAASVADDFVDMGASVVVVGADHPFDSLGDPIRDLAIAPRASEAEEFGSIVPRPEGAASPRTGAGRAAATVKAHQPSLRRVLENLVGNAVRYGKHATVEVTVTGPTVRVVIDDRGPGVPEDQLERIFQPFYRLDASRSRHTGGTGLGLFIARDLVRRDGGELTLANRPEGGLRATVTLPSG